MTRRALLAAVRRRVACRDASFWTAILEPPMLPLDATRVGLLERDLPGGAAAVAPAVAALTAELERRGTGLTSDEAHACLRALGEPYAAWTAESAVAIARQSGLRVNHAGSIGLASWGAARLPTRDASRGRRRV